MDATAEVGKSGRIVIPKKMRDALHLVPGTKITLHQEGDAITLQAEVKPRGLYRKNGMLVYDPGRPVPADAVNWIDQDREERAEANWNW